MAGDHLRAVRGNTAGQKLTAGQASETFPNYNEDDLCLALKAGTVRAGAILDLVPFPAALWSHDRSLCVFNDSTRQLLGFCAQDFSQLNSLWLDRVHPDDRDALATAWNELQTGKGEIGCEYRFLPKHQSHEIRLREVSFSYSLGSEARGVWSFYTQVTRSDEEETQLRPLPELIRGLTHEIANSLQIIRGELDLLRLTGAITQQSSKVITRGVEQILKVTREIEEHIEPPELQLRLEDPVIALNEVIRDSERELAEHSVHIKVGVKEPLPKLPLDCEFRKALRRMIEFSCAFLPQGGQLNIEAGLQRIEETLYVEFSLMNASPTYLKVEEKELFRPFLRVNDCQVGLSMLMAREILRRHFGKIAFHQEHRNPGVFSILVKVPSNK